MSKLLRKMTKKKMLYCILLDKFALHVPNCYDIYREIHLNCRRGKYQKVIKNSSGTTDFALLNQTTNYCYFAENFTQMSKFYLNKSGKGSEKDFSIKVNGFTDNQAEHRLGKIHFELSQFIGKINETVRFDLINCRYPGAAIEFAISVCDSSKLDDAIALNVSNISSDSAPDND